MNKALYGCILPKDLNPTDLCDVGAILCRAIRRRETKNLTHQGYRLPDLSRFLHDPKLPGKESGDCTKVCCRFGQRLAGLYSRPERSECGNCQTKPGDERGTDEV